MTVIDELLGNAEAYGAAFDKGDLPLPPAKRVAILACMDARLNPHALLGLTEGDAHVIRNAGGVVTDDEIRSLAISQRLLGTEEIMLIHHTDCGMQTFRDDDFRQRHVRRGLERRRQHPLACELADFVQEAFEQEGLEADQGSRPFRLGDEGVRHTFGAERERAFGKRQALVTDVDRELPSEHVEPLVLIGVDVPRRTLAGAHCA